MWCSKLTNNPKTNQLQTKNIVSLELMWIRLCDVMTGDLPCYNHGWLALDIKNCIWNRMLLLNVLLNFKGRGFDRTYLQSHRIKYVFFCSHNLAGNQFTCLCATVPVRSSTCWYSNTGEQPWPLGQHLVHIAWCKRGPGFGNKRLPSIAFVQGNLWLHSQIQVSEIKLQLHSMTRDISYNFH